MTDEAKVPEDIGWADIELKFRQLFDDFRVQLLKELYTHSIDPILLDVKEQQAFCAQHTVDLGNVQHDLDGLLKADLRNRTTALETRMKILGVAIYITATAAAASIIGLLLLLLTHQVSLP